MKDSPEGTVWLSYDAEADTLYVNFKKPSQRFHHGDTEEDLCFLPFRSA